MSTEVTVLDEASLQQSIADVRSDATETDWVLVGHVDGNPNVIDVVASGSDGIEGLVPSVDNAQVMYGLLRIHETIDMSKTTKFAYIRWIGVSVSYVKRGKYGVVSGSIEKHFNPYQVVIDADSQDDLDQEKIMNRIQETSGTKSKVLDACEGKTRPERGFTSHTSSNASRVPTSPTSTAPQTVQKIRGHGSSFGGFTQQAKGSSGLAVDDSVKEALEMIRSDANDLNWCLTGFENNKCKNPLKVIASGNEEGNAMVECMNQYLTPATAAYGLIRIIDKVDDIVTVKFVYIRWLGEDVKAMDKARLTTQKGNMEEIFKMAHVNIFATTSSEVTLRAIIDKVSSASGSKSHVK